MGGALVVWALVGLVSVLGPVIPPQMACGLAAVLALAVPGYAVLSLLGIDRELRPPTTLALVPVAGLVAWVPVAVVGFAVGLPLLVVAGLLWTVAGCLIPNTRRVRLPRLGETTGILAGGAAAAIFAWRWEAMLMGDALFHAGVIGKMLAVDRLSLRTIWQFENGHPHAGYAFPLLHMAQAGMAWSAHLDASTAYNEMSPAFAFLIPVAAYAVGDAVAGAAAGILTAILATWDAMSGEGFISYAQQPRYVVTFVLLPVFLALLVQAAPRRNARQSWAIGATLVLVAALHLTYAPPLLLMLAVVSVSYPHLRRVAAWATVACAAFAAWVYLVAIRGGEKLGPQPVDAINFIIIRGHRVALSGYELFQRQPTYLIAGILAVVFAVRMRSTPLGIVSLCAAVMIALTALPGPLLVVQAVTGPGQALRYAQEVPWAYVLGPALVVLARRGAAAVIGIAVLSVVLAQEHLLRGSWATPISVTVGVLALAAVVLVVSRRDRHASRSMRLGSWSLATVLAAAVLAGPVLTHGRAWAHEVVHGKPSGYLTNEPSPGGIAFLRAHDDNLPVVLAPYTPSSGCWYTGIAYELVGNASVYAVAISAFHTEAQPRDFPEQRRAAVDQYLSPSTSASTRDVILGRYNVRYVVIDLKQSPASLISALSADPQLELVYKDPPTPDEYARFAIFERR